MAGRRRIRLRVQIPESDASLPSLFDVHPGTEAMEREVFDMFGITFDGHPDPSRILMPEDWIGHPLRKDYEIGEIPVQFKGAGMTRVTHRGEGSASDGHTARGEPGRRARLENGRR